MANACVCKAGVENDIEELAAAALFEVIVQILAD